MEFLWYNTMQKLLGKFWNIECPFWEKRDKSRNEWYGEGWVRQGTSGTSLVHLTRGGVPGYVSLIPEEIRVGDSLDG